MEIPTFLKAFETELKAYEREFIKITAHPKNTLPLDDQLGLQESKFLGLPFYPVHKEYPKDKDGQPMVMAAQLNFEQIPHLPDFPEQGILQLFLSHTNWYDTDAAIIYHNKEEFTQPTIQDFSFLSNEDYEEIPIFKLHQLSFEKGIDKGGTEDSQFDFLFGQEDYWEFMESLNKDQQEELRNYFDATGHKIGGYAEFTQADPRDYEASKRDDLQLLQIDVDKHIMFGDSGLGHVFISKAHLVQKDFSKAYFYWDCC